MPAPTVDIHAHFYPQSMLDLLADRGYARGTTYASAAPEALSHAAARRYALHDLAFTDVATGNGLSIPRRSSRVLAHG